MTNIKARKPLVVITVDWGDGKIDTYTSESSFEAVSKSYNDNTRGMSLQSYNIMIPKRYIKKIELLDPKEETDDGDITAWINAQPKAKQNAIREIVHERKRKKLSIGGSVLTPIEHLEDICKKRGII